MKQTKTNTSTRSYSRASRKSHLLNFNSDWFNAHFARVSISLNYSSQQNQHLISFSVRPQLTAGQSSYDISVSGGNAAIGDNSEVNVGTGGPR